MLRPTAGWARSGMLDLCPPLPYCRRCSQTDSPELPEVFGNASLPHGNARIFLEVWPAVRAMLDERVTRADPPPQVWVAGFSMGAAGAALPHAKRGSGVGHCCSPGCLLLASRRGRACIRGSLGQAVWMVSSAPGRHLPSLLAAVGNLLAYAVQGHLDQEMGSAVRPARRLHPACACSRRGRPSGTPAPLAMAARAPTPLPPSRARRPPCYPVRGRHPW